MSEWATARSSEFPSQPTDGIDALLRRVEAIKRELNDATNGLLRAAGIGVSPAGMVVGSSLTVEGALASTGNADITGTTHIGGATDIDGTLNVDAATTIGGTLGVTGATTLGGNTGVTGSLGVTGPMTVGGTLDVTGATTFSGDTTIGGNAAITGTLSLPAGIINNDALANPVTFLADFSDTVGPYTLTTSETALTSYTFTVPAGFTRALVVGYGSVGVTNPTASTGSLAGRIYIDIPPAGGGGSVWGPRRFQSATAGWDATTFPYKQTVIGGLSGGESITVRLVGTVWPSTWTSASGGCSLNVQAYFGRG